MTTSTRNSTRNSTRKQPASKAAALSLEDLSHTPPIRATKKMPAEIAELLKPDSGVYIQSEAKPSMDFGFEPVPGAPDMWRVLDNATKGQLRTAVPGLELQPERAPARAKLAEGSVDGYRPPWLDQEFLPRLVPFRLPGWLTGLPEDRVFLEPRAQEAERLTFPWCTVGKVYVQSNVGNWGGSGVIVDRNLMLTAGHLVPWGATSWSMEFIPGFRNEQSNPRPFGNSYVEVIRGYNPEGSVTGWDYAICKLYRPMGDALGWMGSRSFGDEDDYYARDYTSSGYPDTFGGRPAVEFGLGIRDIDNDDPGKELETVYYASDGWSGGPLWYFEGQDPWVVGVVSGSEKDGLDPTRHVHAGYKGMMDLIFYGKEHWPV